MAAIKIAYAGDSKLFDTGVDYNAGATVVSPDDGEIYVANDAVPKGTPFTVGTTGATWKRPGRQGHIFEDEADANVKYEVFFKHGLMAVRVTA